MDTLSVSLCATSSFSGKTCLFSMGESMRLECCLLATQLHRPTAACGNLPCSSACGEDRMSRMGIVLPVLGMNVLASYTFLNSVLTFCVFKKLLNWVWVIHGKVSSRFTVRNAPIF
jgi:hypothetical protein